MWPVRAAPWHLQSKPALCRLHFRPSDARPIALRPSPKLWRGTFRVKCLLSVLAIECLLRSRCKHFPWHLTCGCGTVSLQKEFHRAAKDCSFAARRFPLWVFSPFWESGKGFAHTKRAHPAALASTAPSASSSAARSTGLPRYASMPASRACWRTASSEPAVIANTGT